MPDIEDLEHRLRVLEEDKIRRDATEAALKGSGERRLKRLDLLIRILGLGGIFAGVAQIARLAFRWFLQHVHI